VKNKSGLGNKAKVTPEKESVEPSGPPASIPLPATPPKTKNNPIDVDQSPTPELSPITIRMRDIDSPPTTPKRRNQTHTNWDADVINNRDYSVFFDLQMEVPKIVKEEAVGALKDVATKFISVLQDADSKHFFIIIF
jgi:hypothetical protein